MDSLDIEHIYKIEECLCFYIATFSHLRSDLDSVEHILSPR